MYGSKDYTSIPDIIILAQEGHGTQSRLAGQQNIDRGYANAIVKGRKPGSEEVRTKIAGHFNINYKDMLALGRSIPEGRKRSAHSGGKKGREKVWQ